MKTILITGSSSGIGLATAQALLKQGDRVIGLSRTPSNIVHKHFQEYSLDLSKPNMLENWLKDHLSQYQFDGFIYAAGIGVFAHLEQLNLRDIQTSMQVNSLAAMQISKALVPLLKKQKYGFGIFIGSEAAINGAKQSCAYSASKFALRGFVQSLVQEVRASHIDITLINPGLVKTNFHQACDFQPSDDEDSAIDIDLIVYQILQLINQKGMGFVSEINMQPYKNIIQKKK